MSVSLKPSGCVCLPAGFGDDMPFNYFTYGAACSEVELDSLTGDFQALRTHICMDVGTSVNPAIDIGQVEGGFIQVCHCWCTTLHPAPCLCVVINTICQQALLLPLLLPLSGL